MTAGAQAALLPAASAAASAGESRPPSGYRTPEPKVFFYDDGRHAAGLYQFAPPFDAADVTFNLDQVVEAGVDTLFYSAGLEGGVVQYDSRVAAKWGDNVRVWTHPIFYRAARNLRQLIADGLDPMKVLSQRAHEKGIWFLPTVSVGTLGNERETSLGLGRHSDFTYDNPQFQVGPDDDPRARKPARFLGPKRLSFLHREVRDERFRICEELLTRYETDGIELDLSIDNDFGPLCKFAEVGRLAPLLTQWIADLRAVAGKAAKAQGRKKRIYVRIPAGPAESWDVVGFQVPQWASRKLVDGLMCVTTHRAMLDQDVDIAAALNAVKGTGCRVLAGFEANLARQLEGSATAPMTWAAAANAYHRGADGFGLCEGMWAPNGWPWRDEDYATLRLLGHPDLLATADKTYRARSMNRGATFSPGLFHTAGPVLPHPLRQGESVDIPLRVADDLPRWQALGRISGVRLRLRFTNLEPSLNDVRVALNGQTLPDSLARKIDLHFHVVEAGPVNPYGYIYEFPLTPEMYPRQGDNRIQVTLVKRDPNLNAPFEVYDADCSIDYRVHRHFERKPLEY